MPTGGAEETEPRPAGRKCCGLVILLTAEGAVAVLALLAVLAVLVAVSAGSSEWTVHLIPKPAARIRRQHCVKGICKTNSESAARDRGLIEAVGNETVYIHYDKIGSCSADSCLICVLHRG